MDRETLYLIGGTLAALAVATILGGVIRRRAVTERGIATAANLNARIRAWWIMTAIFGLALATGGTASIVMFACTSFLALREFYTMTPTNPGDHRALFWAFFVVTPLQYVLLAVEWYNMFVIFIPVYAFLLLPIRAAAAGETERFIDRTAKIQWGLMICVYCCSHAPAILMLKIPGFEGQTARLLFYFVLICELSDVLQYVFGKLFGRHAVAPLVSPHKTWEGLLGGGAATVLIGSGLSWATPFTMGQAAGISLAVVMMGFGGGLVMSAMKRDRGVKDWGTAISGHGGILDRIDSLCFAAPIFFHLVRYYFTVD
jgi:phosphatidate cytidylyltransferase